MATCPSQSRWGACLLISFPSMHNKTCILNSILGVKYTLTDVQAAKAWIMFSYGAFACADLLKGAGDRQGADCKVVAQMSWSVLRGNCTCMQCLYYLISIPTAAQKYRSYQGGNAQKPALSSPLKVSHTTAAHITLRTWAP